MGTPQGDDAPADTLGAVFEEHADRVYGYAVRRCGDPALAEDLTAIAFEAASRRFAHGQGHEVSLAWLLTVVRRRLIDHWRNSERHSRKVAWLRNEVLVQPIEADESLSGVDVAIRSLAENQRAALVLRYLEDYSVSEVAETLGMTYKAAESLLSRARRSFSHAYWEHR